MSSNNNSSSVGIVIPAQSSFNSRNSINTINNSINIQNVFEPNMNRVEYEKNIHIDETRKQLKRLFAKRGQTRDLDVILEILLNCTTNNNAYPLPFQGFLDERYTVSKKPGSYRIDKNEIGTICRDVNRSFSAELGVDTYLSNQNTNKTYFPRCQNQDPVFKVERTIHSKNLSTLMDRLESNLHQTLDNSMYEYYQNLSKYMALFIISTKSDDYSQQLFLQTNRDNLRFMKSHDLFNDTMLNILPKIFEVLCEKNNILFNIENINDQIILSQDIITSFLTLYVGPTSNYILSQILADLLLRTHPLFSLYITLALIIHYRERSTESEPPERLIHLLIEDQYKYCGKPDFYLDLSKSILKQRSELRLFEKDSPFRIMLETALRVYAAYPPEELLKSYDIEGLQNRWPEIFCDTVGGSHVSYNPSEETIRIYTNMELDPYDRNFLYIQLEIPGEAASLRPFKGDLKTLAGHFERKEVVDLHPQIAFLMYYNHDASNDLRTLLYTVFDEMYGPSALVDQELKDCLDARILDQYRMGYFILCHAIRNGLYADAPILDFYRMTNEDKFGYFQSYLSKNRTFFGIEQNIVLTRWARDQPRKNIFRRGIQCLIPGTKEKQSPLQTASQFLAFYKELKPPVVRKGGAHRRRTYRKRSLHNNNEENNNYFSRFVNARGPNNEEEENLSGFENARSNGLHRQIENVNMTRRNRNTLSVYNPLQIPTNSIVPRSPTLQPMTNALTNRNVSVPSVTSNLHVRNAAKNIEKLSYMPYNPSKYHPNTTRKRIKKQFAPVRSTRYRRVSRK